MFYVISAGFKLEEVWLIYQGKLDTPGQRKDEQRCGAVVGAPHMRPERISHHLWPIV